ncbi:hypothetical protein HDN1F_36210 [gamma proteobacterium HdN1]|nr:hypothetical protein HDN1F_36210 [gamma proteobacterium HdN1]
MRNWILFIALAFCSNTGLCDGTILGISLGSTPQEVKDALLVNNVKWDVSLVNNYGMISGKTEILATIKDDSGRVIDQAWILFSDVEYRAYYIARIVRFNKNVMPRLLDLRNHIVKSLGEPGYESSKPERGVDFLFWASRNDGTAIKGEPEILTTGCFSREFNNRALGGIGVVSIYPPSTFYKTCGYYAGVYLVGDQDNPLLAFAASMEIGNHQVALEGLTKMRKIDAVNKLNDAKNSEINRDKFLPKI